MKDHIDALEINEYTLPVISDLANNLPGGFLIYHADGDEELIFFNKKVPALYGYEDDGEFIQHVGNSFRGMVHPEDLNRVEAEIASQIGSSDASQDHVLYRVIRKDGSVRYFNDYGHFVRSKTYGDIYYVYLIDVTDEIDLKHELEEDRKQLELAKKLEQSRAAIAALGGAYDYISMVNLETHEEQIFKYNPAFTVLIPGWEKLNTYRERMKIICDLFIHPGDQASFCMRPIWTC